MRPIFESFASVRRLQEMWSTARDTTPRAEVERAAGDVVLKLAQHEELAAQQIAAVLAKTSAPELQERLDAVRARWSELREEIGDFVRQLPAAGEAWPFVWDELQNLLGRRFRGGGVRTIDEPFGGFLAPEAASVAPAAPDVREMPEAAIPDAPDAEDLKPLAGHFAPEIESLARALGDAEAIARFVSEQLAFSPYAGHFRAPAEVLLDRVGNDADLSALLVELLRAARIPARFATGNVRESLRDLGDALDVASPSVLMKLLEESGRTVFVQRNGDALEADLWNRVWVRAWIGGRWIDVDPSERVLDVEPGRALSSIDRWTAAGDMLDSVEREYLEDPDATRGPLQFFEQHLHRALRLTGAPPDEPLESFFRARKVVPAQQFPAPLRGQRLLPPSVSRTLDAADPWTVTVQLVALNVGTIFETTLPLPGRNRASWSLSWQPANDVAQAFLDTGRGIGGLPLFAVELRPRIEIRHAGRHVETIDGSGTAFAGTQVFLHVSAKQHRGESRIIAGEEWVMRIEPPAADLAALAVPHQIAPANVDSFASSLLEIYHRRLAGTARRIALLGDGITMCGPWISLLGSHLEPYIVARQPAALIRSQWLLDVKVIPHALYSSIDSSSRRGLEELFLAEGSYLEAEWFRALMKRPATSAVEALRKAVADGNPLVTITRGDDAAMASLEHPPGVINALSIALATRHRAITISQRPVRVGRREVAAWIARRDTAPPSEYAIAGLNGGILDDPPPEPEREPEVFVYITRDRAGTVIDIGETVTFDAIAFDDEGRSWSGSIVWDSHPSCGGGGGATAAFTPTELGGVIVRARVPSAPNDRTPEDGAVIIVPTMEVTEITVPQPAVRLSRVDESAATLKIDNIEGPLFAKQKTSDPAALWCGKEIGIDVRLVVETPLRPFKIRVKAEDADGRVIVEEQSTTVSTDEVTLHMRLRAQDKLGVVRSLKWSFALEERSFLAERDRPVECEIYISRSQPIPHLGHVEAHICKWACDWTNDFGADANDAGLLARMLSRREQTDTNPRLTYRGFDLGSMSAVDAYGLIAGKRGMCGEFADWFLALARIHGIDGRRYRLMVVIPRDPVFREEKWGRWLLPARGVNHVEFNTPATPYPVVAREHYVTHATDEEFLLSPDEAGPPFDRAQYWMFTRHYLAVFELPQGTVICDASFQPGEGIDFIVFPERLIAGTHTVPPGGKLRVYLQSVMPILYGGILVTKHDVLGTHVDKEYVYVWHEDLVLDGPEGPEGESIQVTWVQA